MQRGKRTIIRVFPGFDLFRYSFYVTGLRQAFPGARFVLTTRGFPDFHQHCLAFEVLEERSLKVYISAGDGPGYNENGLEWADVYAKRTLLEERVPEEYSANIIPMGPHFGVRVWGYLRSLIHGLHALLAAGGSIDSPRRHLVNCIRQVRSRLPEDQFQPAPSRDDYVFYSSTLYPTHPNYNRYRANFIRACRSVEDLAFEGGLSRTDGLSIEEYKDVTTISRYRIGEWWSKTQLSLVGFWAPGDQGAMTLKLGEYLAAGKVIIGLPVPHGMLPAPLLDRVHMIEVDGEISSIRNALQEIRHDTSLRRRIERNARDYYEEYLTPRRAIERFVGEARRRVSHR
ncbi:MAG: hypothetical protein K8J08_21895 [Thermoanaerobaculia bacterium]|nr:hypothetical protein [Thermoanaerobaculia bacterium]